VIVRLSNTAEAQLQIDRVSEARVLAVVAAAGLGPEVLCCEPQEHVLVTRDAGPTWHESDALRAPNIQRVGVLLKRLHALDVPVGIREVDLIATVTGYLNVLAARESVSQLTASATQRRAEHAALALRQGAAQCLCHNDVHSLNIVDDGSLRLIDWEYSGIGEPMFDLASICVYHHYTRLDRERLLEAYLTTPTSNAAHQLELACWLFEYVKDLWTEVRGG
jgi:thiamine kinase-like enzyme